VNERLYSASWYRVAGLRPRLRAHVEIHRHHYRGRLWYVLQDPASERFHRFTPAAHTVIANLDGERTVEELWRLASESLGDAAPTQEEMVQILSQLHAADVLASDVPPDIVELLKRHERFERRRWLAQILNPLFWRFPVFDPERLLQSTVHLVKPFFGKLGLAMWLAAVGPAAVLGAMHWDDLVRDVADRVLSPQNLVMLWFLFPLLKAFHELGHAYAVKAYGGQVHEIGILLMVLTPMPYVNASAASAFRSKRQRIVVGAAGMLVETFIASLAFFLWLNTASGFLRAALYDVVFIAGVSTVLFNANPLLRYDGYYILCDLFELPNLRARSERYLIYLMQRRLFGRKDAQPPPASASERAWFVFYGLASAIYRFVILAAIVVFIAGKFFFIGVLLALWGLLVWVAAPLARGLRSLLVGPELARVRGRAIAASAALAAAAAALAALLPVPLRTVTQGVIWIPENAIVRAGADGFIEELLAVPNRQVQPGDPLVRSDDPIERTRLRVLEAELRELEARHAEAWVRNRAEADLIQEEMDHTRESVARSRERIEDLTLRSAAAGTFVVAAPEDLPGRFLKKGEPIAHVLDLSVLTARVVVPQADSDLVRRRTRRIEVRSADSPDRVLEAAVLREVPAALAELPSPALGTPSGGEMPVDPADAGGTRTLEPHFQLDLVLPSSAGIVNVGGRVHVRFDHGWEPLVYRWHRSLRQLLLSHLNV
jgi:putative peptide zinc metalloprotease protein